MEKDFMNCLYPFRRYYGEERRGSRAAWLGPERRLPDPSTEQDHPEECEPQAAEAR